MPITGTWPGRSRVLSETGCSAWKSFSTHGRCLWSCCFFAGLGQVLGGWRLTLLAVVSVLGWAVLGQWDASLQTLALMGMSVAITLILGFPVGILAGSSRLVRAVVTPLLDAMQTMPAFVYLVPAIFFFGVGATTAIMATVIYALPPIIRMTSHGLRSTPDNLIEVADSFGASPLQIFLRVRLPHALGAVLVGVNQTIMMALGLVVLAAMVGAPGLGTEIWLALQKLNVGKALEGGICIVFMAMLLDRLMDAATGPMAAMRARLSTSGWQPTKPPGGPGFPSDPIARRGMRSRRMFVRHPCPEKGSGPARSMQMVAKSIVQDRCGTPFHDRTSKLNQTTWWYGWSQYVIPDVFTSVEEEVASIRNAVAMIDMSPLTAAEAVNLALLDWLATGRKEAAA